MPQQSSLADNLVRLTRTIDAFCAQVEALPAGKPGSPEWCPREVLAHLVYHHEQYVAQVEAVLAGNDFPLAAGTFKRINARAVEKLGGLPVRTLTRRLTAANRRLCALARENDPRRIAFTLKQGSKRWRLVDLIPAVEAHIREHGRKLGG